MGRRKVLKGGRAVELNDIILYLVAAVLSFGGGYWARSKSDPFSHLSLDRLNVEQRKCLSWAREWVSPEGKKVRWGEYDG